MKPQFRRPSLSESQEISREGRVVRLSPNGTNDLRSRTEPVCVRRYHRSQVENNGDVTV